MKYLIVGAILTAFSIPMLSYMYSTDRDVVSESRLDLSINRQQNSQMPGVETDQSRHKKIPRESADIKSSPATFEELDNADDAVKWKTYYDHNDWFESKGFYSQEERDTYSGYSVETLAALAKSGDTIALNILGDEVLDQGRFQDAARVYHTAAVYGSVESLQKMAVLHETLAAKSLSEGNLLKTRENLADMAVLFQISAMRGYTPAIETGVSLLNRYDVRFTDAELQEISAKSDVIYSEMLKIREDMGLGPFDDAVSSFARIAHQTDADSLVSRSGWGRDLSRKLYNLE